MNKILIVGTGSYASAIAETLLSREDNDVLMYGIDKEEIKDINENQKNSKYFGDIKLNKRIKATDNLDVAVENRDIIMMATPAAVVIKMVRELIKKINVAVIWINLAKGFNYEERILIIKQFERTLPLNLNKGLCKISGPTFADELITKNPSSLTISCQTIQTAERIQKLFENNYILSEITEDLIGVEFFSIIKNSLAIFLGIMNGLNLSENTKAMLFIICVKEIYKFRGKYPTIQWETFLGYSGLGDFYLTGSSRKSRNFNLGFEIASKGSYDINFHKDETLEGVKSIGILLKIAKKEKIKLNILPVLNSIILNKYSPMDGINNLITNIKKIK